MIKISIKGNRAPIITDLTPTEAPFFEGAYCPDPNCEGSIVFLPVEDCRCHMCTPCSACVENTLECSICGMTEDDLDHI